MATKTRSAWLGGLAAVAMAVLLLGATACGGGGGDDDDGAGDASAGGWAGAATTTPRQDDDPCLLLEVAEIEVQFGDQGAVADGQSHRAANGSLSCLWEVGAGSDDPPIVNLTTFDPPSESAEDYLAETREGRAGAVDVDGVGEEAFFDVNSVYLRSGDMYVALSIFPAPEGAALQDELVALAQQVVGRL